MSDKNDKKNPIYHPEPSQCYSCGQNSNYYTHCHAQFYGLCNNIICNYCWYGSIHEIEKKPKLYMVEYENPDDDLIPAFSFVCRKECSEKINGSTSMEEIKKEIRPLGYGFCIYDQRQRNGGFLYENANSKEVVVVTEVVEALSLEEAVLRITPRYYINLRGNFNFYVGIVGKFRGKV